MPGIHTKSIIDMLLRVYDNYDEGERLLALNRKIKYLENQHYKLKNNIHYSIGELSPRDKELLSYIKAKLKALQKLREKVIEETTFKEYEERKTARAGNDEGDKTDRRRGPRGFKEMWDYIEDELNWSQEEARKWVKEYGSMNAAANEMIKWLKKRFPEAKKYPGPTRVHEKLGYKPDSGTYVLGSNKE